MWTTNHFLLHCNCSDRGRVYNHCSKMRSNQHSLLLPNKIVEYQVFYLVIIGTVIRNTYTKTTNIENKIFWTFSRCIRGPKTSYMGTIYTKFSINSKIYLSNYIFFKWLINFFIVIVSNNNHNLRADSTDLCVMNYYNI